MNKIAISVFDSRYFEYAVRMYISLRAFNPAIELFAGDLGLSQSERRLLASLGVTVLQTDRTKVLKARLLHPTYGHFLLHSYLKGVEWEKIAWIDADTLILDDISELYSFDVDLVGHPGRSSKGPIYTLGQAYPYHPSAAREWIAQYLPCGDDTPYFSGGVWCTSSRRLIEFLDSLLDVVPPEVFPGEPPVFTAAIQHLGLSSHQLNPSLWNFSRELLAHAQLKNGRIVYGEGISPKTAAFSYTDNGTKASSNAVDEFYDVVIRKQPWKRPLESVIRYVTEEKYTQMPARKLRMLHDSVTDVLSKDVPGDLVECGVGRGGPALVIANAAARANRRLHLFDTFRGISTPSKVDFHKDHTYPRALIQEGRTNGKSSLVGDEIVRDLLLRLGLDLDQVSITKCRIGKNRATVANRLWRAVRKLTGLNHQSADNLIAKFPNRISFLHIDTDSYVSYRWLLLSLYRRVSHGGVIVFDDYVYGNGAKRVVDEFLTQSGEELRSTNTSQRFIVKTQKVYMNLDDFCEEYMTQPRWEQLHDLRRIYPDLKVTMFTIPGKSSPQWLRWVKNEYPWIEMALHGTRHEDPSEWLTSAADALQKVQWVYNEEIYAKGFKAPWWKLSKEAYVALRNAGFWVATNKTNAFVRAKDSLNYTYDAGDEVLPDVHYRLPYFDTWHGHVQSQKEYGAALPNGLEDVYDRIAKAWHPQSRFGFISDLFQ